MAADRHWVLDRGGGRALLLPTLQAAAKRRASSPCPGPIRWSAKEMSAAFQEKSETSATPFGPPLTNENGLGPPTRPCKTDRKPAGGHAGPKYRFRFSRRPRNEGAVGRLRTTRLRTYPSRSRAMPRRLRHKRRSNASRRDRPSKQSREPADSPQRSDRHGRRPDGLGEGKDGEIIEIGTAIQRADHPDPSSIRFW